MVLVDAAAPRCRHIHHQLQGPAANERVFHNVLNEIRNALIGSSLLFSGLITAAFAPQFSQLTNTELVFYGVSVLLVFLGTMLLISPAIQQQIYRSELVAEMLAPYLITSGFITVHLGLICAIATIAHFIYNSNGLTIALVPSLFGFVLFIWFVLPLLVTFKKIPPAA